jgi:hypothetical protein
MLQRQREGTRKNVIKTNRFEEICNYQVTPFEGGRRNIILPHRPAAN